MIVKQSYKEMIVSFIPVPVSDEAGFIVSALVYVGFLLREIGEPVSYRKMMRALDRKAKAPEGSCRRLLRKELSNGHPEDFGRLTDYLKWLEDQFREVMFREG